MSAPNPASVTGIGNIKKFVKGFWVEKSYSDHINQNLLPRKKIFKKGRSLPPTQKANKNTPHSTHLPTKPSLPTSFSAILSANREEFPCAILAKGPA